MLLPFFERPYWCRLRIKAEDYTSTTKERLLDGCDQDQWPGWGLPILSETAASILEMIFLLILLFFIFFRRAYRVVSKTGTIR